MQPMNRVPEPDFSHAIPKRSHLLLMVAFFFLIGCVSISWFCAGAWLWGLAAIGAALLLLDGRGGGLRALGIAFLCFSLGLLHAHAACDVPMPEAGRYDISGYVYGSADLRDEKRLTFVLDDICLNGQPVQGKAYCSVRFEEAPPELFDGAQVCLDGYVYHPSGKSGEPRLDFRLWMRQKSYAFGISGYDGLSVENAAADAPVMDAAHRIREVFSAAFERTMGANGRIAMALLFGQRDGLTEDEYASFQTLGIAHIMSVSGLHVGLVGAGLMLALDRFRIKRRTKLLILAFCLLDYCALTGFSAASLRAAVMLVSASLSRLFLRRGDRLTTLAAAMLAVLLIDPLSALSAGFVLSFSAMLGILLFIQPVLEVLDKLWPPKEIRPSADKRSEWPAWLQRQLKSLLAVSFTAQLGVLLPTMRFFHQLPLYGILINLLIVPLAGSVLVPLYVLTLASSLFPFIGALIGGAASLATEALLQLVSLLSSLPCAVIRTAAPPVLVCIGLGASLVMLSRRMPGSLLSRVTAAALTAAVALGGWAVQKPAALRYIQLDAGQADAAILMDGKATVVIDTGEDGSAVIDYLLHENRDVDALILTHLHADHAGGAEAILQSGVKVHQICLPVHAEKQLLDEQMAALFQRLQASGVAITPLASGDELRYNRSCIRILWPEREAVRTGHEANDYSLALAIDLDGFTLFSAGDLTGAYEKYAAVAADVLKIAHHGSAESTLSAFLDHVSPSSALLTVSGGSRALPHEALLERLSSRNIRLFRTDECGDITLSVENGRLSITPYKERTLP